MKFFGIFSLLFLSWSATAMADMSELASVLPSCALNCFPPALEQSGCALTNETCMCTNTVFTDSLTLCVSAACTIRESLTTKNITMTACGAPIRDRGQLVIGTGLGGGVIALIFFIMRIISRFPCCGGQFGMDDAVMVVTMVFLIPLSALSVVLANAGLGRDMWTVPFDGITRILYIYFWDELIYLTVIPLTKISILCFYLRVFPTRSFRIGTYIVIGLNIAFWLVFLLISIFQCKPLDGAWLQWDGEAMYKCNDINAQGWAAAAINMTLDIMVMILPLRELYALNLSIQKRLFVMGMFSLGIFVTLVSILRLNSLIHFAHTDNLTWDYVEVGYWSLIEADVGVICACLPAMRSLLRRLWPSRFGTTTPTTSKISITRSVTRSVQAGTRLDGVTSNCWSEGKFVPLVDIDTSRETSSRQQLTREFSD